MNSGYTHCACRDCMEIVVSNDMKHPDFCADCEEAGCDINAECLCDEPEPEPTLASFLADHLVIKIVR